MATDIGKAFVQIVPSAQGIKGSIEGVLGGEADSAGKGAGLKIAGGIKKMIAAAGVGVAIKQSLEAGGALQQSFGGLDTLYGDAADAAKAYAKEAYKAGISANSYAEQAVSFGASLKQAFGGDTTSAMEAANTAILDMADNAAKMGTPIESIQQAYQGFAKGQYMLLDNLKLGYGGTKTEMERLLKDASELSGKEYNIDNLGDVYEAIHVIQGELGLTGVAAKEASETFTGSFEAMKAAGENVLASLMLGQDVGPAMQSLVESMVTFVGGNLIPAIGNIFMSLPSAIGTAISTGLPLIAEQAGSLITALTDGINTKVPELVQKLPMAVFSAFANLSSVMPQVMAKGSELITGLGKAIIDNAPALASAAAGAIQSFVGFVSANLPLIGEKGGELVGELAKGIITHLPQILTAVAKIGVFLVQNMAKINASMIRAGLNLVKGVASGIRSGIGSAITGVMNKVKDAITRPIQNAKDKVKGIMDRIAGMFPFNIGKIINLSLPSISMNTGSKTVLGKTITYPTGFNITWHAKAMENPYLFSGATLFGAGETGDEILYGRDRLMKDIDEAVNGNGRGDVTINLNYDASEDATDMLRDIVRGVKRYRMAGAI